MGALQQMLLGIGGAAAALQTIQFRGKGADAVPVTGAAQYPTGWQVGDLMILFVETANEAITGPPAGWTELASSPQGTGTAAGSASSRLTAWWRIAQTGDAGASITGTYNHCIGFILGFYNVDQVTPFDVTPVGDVEASAVTAITYPSITTATDGSMIVFVTSNQVDTSTSQVSAATFAGLASVTGPSLYQITFGNGGGIYAFYGRKTTAGSTGTGSSTALNATVQGRMTIALRPAA